MNDSTSGNILQYSVPSINNGVILCFFEFPETPKAIIFLYDVLSNKCFP